MDTTPGNQKRAKRDEVIGSQNRRHRSIVAFVYTQTTDLNKLLERSQVRSRSVTANLLRPISLLVFRPDLVVMQLTHKHFFVYGLP